MSGELADVDSFWEEDSFWKGRQPPTTCVGYYVHDEWNTQRRFRWTEHGFFRNCKQEQPESGPTCHWGFEELDRDWVGAMRRLVASWKIPGFWAQCEVQSRVMSPYRDHPEEMPAFETCSLRPLLWAPLWCTQRKGPYRPSWFKTKVLRHRTWTVCAHV